jgi:hypothetical protein
MRSIKALKKKHPNATIIQCRVVHKGGLLWAFEGSTRDEIAEAIWDLLMNGMKPKTETIT